MNLKPLNPLIIRKILSTVGLKNWDQNGVVDRRYGVELASADCPAVRLLVPSLGALVAVTDCQSSLLFVAYRLVGKLHSHCDN